MGLSFWKRQDYDEIGRFGWVFLGNKNVLYISYNTYIMFLGTEIYFISYNTYTIFTVDHEND